MIEPGRRVQYQWLAIGLRFKDELFLDIFEESVFQAARSVSVSRKEYLADLVAEGLGSTEFVHSEKKMLLNLLNELSDPEVILLQYHGLPPRERSDYVKQHMDVIVARPASVTDPEEERNKSVLVDAHKFHLARLNLLVAQYKNPKRNELPEFDSQTGQMKANNYKITPLGRMLLRNIGLRTF